MRQRILSLYFPSFAIDRLELEDSSRRQRPFAVGVEIRGHLRIGAANTLAAKAGIRSGMRLSDARILTPDLEIVAADPDLDHSTLLDWTRWCNRYTPIASHDGTGGIWLDITGCAHLFGGETRLLRNLESRLHNQKFHARGSIAHNFAAAWALARYSKRRIVSQADVVEALSPLPIQALRLPEEAVKQLRRIGVVTIESLRKLSRNSLTARYGSQVVLRIDQAFEGAEEPFTPYLPPVPCWAGKKFEHPLVDLAMLEYALERLLKQVCACLERKQAGARLIRVDCHRVDGEILSCEIATVKPVRVLNHLLKLFSEKLRLLDFGCGVERLVLIANSSEEKNSTQLSLEGHTSALKKENDFEALLDRLGLRLGFEPICRMRVSESFLPESSVKFRPISQSDTADASWPEYRIRPIELLQQPRRIAVYETAGNLPVAVQIEHQWRDIVHADGPERLTAEWWRDNASSLAHRDYFRIEDSQSERLWIFRDSNECWYLHGRFA